MEPIPLKKITTAAILEPRQLKTSIPKETEKLCVIYGVVTGAQKKGTKFNENQMVLTGRFEAVRASDRQEFTGGFLYLPDNTYQDQLAEMCVNRETGEVREISFGFVISAKPMSSSPVGYAFVMEPMLDQKAQDALADVRKTVSSNLQKFLPALPAPASATSAKK